jgi:hypothetical protein
MANVRGETSIGGVGVNPVLDEILRSGTTGGPDGGTHKVYAEVLRSEGEFLQRIIREASRR